MVDRLAYARPDIPHQLGDRAADAWEPLLAIADAAGGDWPKQARAAAIALSGERKVPGGGAGAVSLTFGTFAEDFGLPVANVIDMFGVDLDPPFTDMPERLVDVRVQAWFVDLDGQAVVIMVKSLPDTPPELVAEAEAVVASIRVDPDCGGAGPRLLFDLPDGWDRG